MENWDKYLKYVTLAEKEFPNDIVIKSRFMEYYYEIGNYSKAKEYAEKILKINPNSEGAKLYLNLIK